MNEMHVSVAGQVTGSVVADGNDLQVPSYLSQKCARVIIGTEANRVDRIGSDRRLLESGSEFFSISFFMTIKDFVRPSFRIRAIATSSSSSPASRHFRNAFNRNHPKFGTLFVS